MEIFDPVFNMHKIKFDILDKWLLVDKKTTNVNVFINLDNVFKFIINPRTNNFIQASASVKGKEEFTNKAVRSLVSNIINLGQHYRLWLAKKSIESKIYLYWNYPAPETYKNSKYLPTYRTNYNIKHSKGIETSHIISIMEKAVEFCSKCIPYINEVYLINSGDIEASLIPLIITDKIYNNSFSKNIMISSSSYDLAYVNYDFTVAVPSMKKKPPYYVNKQNVIEVMKMRHKISSPISVKSTFVEVINALLGDTDRSIPTINGVGLYYIMNTILSSLDKGYITNETKDIDMIKNIVKDEYKDIFERNYRCSSLYYQLNDIEPLDVHKITSFLVDKYDETTLREMNEKYFKLCPIEIIRPKSEQVLYDSNPYNTSIFDRK